jgi:hypothetical protein
VNPAGHGAGESVSWVSVGGYPCSGVKRGKGLLSTVSGTWVAGDGV